MSSMAITNTNLNTNYTTDKSSNSSMTDTVVNSVWDIGSDAIESIGNGEGAGVNAANIMANIGSKIASSAIKALMQMLIGGISDLSNATAAKAEEVAEKAKGTAEITTAQAKSLAIAVPKLQGMMESGLTTVSQYLTEIDNLLAQGTETTDLLQAQQERQTELNESNQEIYEELESYGINIGGDENGENDGNNSHEIDPNDTDGKCYGDSLVEKYSGQISGSPDAERINELLQQLGKNEVELKAINIAVEDLHCQLQETTTQITQNGEQAKNEQDQTQVNLNNTTTEMTENVEQNVNKPTNTYANKAQSNGTEQTTQSTVDIFAGDALLTKAGFESLCLFTEAQAAQDAEKGAENITAGGIQEANAMKNFLDSKIMKSLGKKMISAGVGKLKSLLSEQIGKLTENDPTGIANMALTTLSDGLLDESKAAIMNPNAGKKAQTT